MPVLVVMALLLVGLPTVRLMAQEEQGSIPGLVLNSNAPGELVVSWETPDPEPSDYRISWAPASQGYPSWRDANEDDRSNAYPDGSARFSARQVTSARSAKNSSPACKRPAVGHWPSGTGWESTPATTSSIRPFRTAQTTSSCFVLMPSLSCMR